jgi:hypothetical protein
MSFSEKRISETEDIITCPVHFIDVFTQEQCTDCFEKFYHTACPFHTPLVDELDSLTDEEEEEEDDLEFDDDSDSDDEL